jgi:hypothetical protein
LDHFVAKFGLDEHALSSSEHTLPVVLTSEQIQEKQTEMILLHHEQALKAASVPAVRASNNSE